MVEAIPFRGSALNVVGPSALEKHLKEQDERKARVEDEAKQAGESQTVTSLGNFIRKQFDIFKRHRDNPTAGWSHRLLAALRAFNGKYDSQKLSEIKRFGGSEIYARVVAVKCRGASSLLRDIYLSQDRSWGILPPHDPDVPPHIIATIKQLVTSELQGMVQMGVPPPNQDQIRDRVFQLVDSARQAARKQATDRADLAEDKLDEILSDGGFYKALAEFLVDLPLFPFACIKGPVVRIAPSVSWAGGSAKVVQKPRMTWQRISPFDLYFSPGVSDVEDAAVIERQRYTRADLNDLLDLPGYNHDAILKVLDEYGRGGLVDTHDGTDAERAAAENRENPTLNESGIIEGLEYNGNVQGRMLLDIGMDEQDVPDPLRDYMVQAWVIGRHVIKVQLSPSPRKRHPYFISSFEKVPGTPVGNGLPDILEDIQEAANATMRSLVNNLSISSGPQVVVNDDRLAPGEDGESMFPWKRWHVSSDPMGNNASQPPISFFQPGSNAQELLGVYKFLTDQADELSAIPKYLNGQNAGGAGRTASGLAMLMGNAAKILQMVAANVDRDVLTPLLTGLFDMMMLTDDTGLLQGDELIRVLGVTVAIQRETQRARQLEFLQITANPLDSQIMGMKGRAKVLRSVSGTIGLDGEGVVPSDDELAKKELEMQQQQQMMALAAQAQGGQRGAAVNKDTGPRVNLGGAPGSPGAVGPPKIAGGAG